MSTSSFTLGIDDRADTVSARSGPIYGGHGQKLGRIGPSATDARSKPGLDYPRSRCERFRAKLQLKPVIACGDGAA